MNPKSYDQLSLLERVLYTEHFGGQDQDTYPRPVPYSLIKSIRHTGWICTIDDRMLNPDYYCPAPVAHPLDYIDEQETGVRAPDLFKNWAKTTLKSLPTKHIDGDCLGLPTKKKRSKKIDSPPKNEPSSFGGQAQDAHKLNSETPAVSVFGVFWIEFSYKKIKGKRYGPYLVKRWRDDKGCKRSRYLGKAPTEPATPDLPA